MKRLRRHRRFLGWFMIVLMFPWMSQSPIYGATYFWLPEALGSGPGADGTWNTSNLNWHPGGFAASGTNWDNNTLNTALFGDNSTGEVPSSVTISTPVTAEGIAFDAPGMTLSSGNVFKSTSAATADGNT